MVPATIAARHGPSLPEGYAGVSLVGWWDAPGGEQRQQPRARLSQLGEMVAADGERCDPPPA
jgi:hypothetical protein